MDISETAIAENFNILFRGKEIVLLSRFFRNKAGFQHRSLFIYGPTATGKTLVLSKLFKKFSLPHLWVDCNEYYTSQLIFSKVVNHLLKYESEYKKVSTALDFTTFLKENLSSAGKCFYLVFDNAEVLRNEETLIILLLKLQSITKVNICTVIISEFYFHDFLPYHYTQPIILHFPTYSKSEICEILSLNCPDGTNSNFYSGYVNVIMRTFYPITNNLSELKYLLINNFDKYCEPINKDPEFEVSSLRLWKSIEPTLKEAIRCVYLREISGTKWKAHCKEEGKENKIPSGTITSCITRELPFFSKFLLLAAYFASYNPPKSDFKHFVKNQGKQKKKRITKRVEKNRHLLGPRPFSLDRLLSIFFSIVGERVLPSALIFSQISSLVHMRLMSRVSTDEQLDCPKYKCLAELDLVSKIGKTVNIDVMGYLDDFL